MKVNFAGKCIEVKQMDIPWWVDRLKVPLVDIILIFN